MKRLTISSFYIAATIILLASCNNNDISGKNPDGNRNGMTIANMESPHEKYSCEYDDKGRIIRLTDEQIHTTQEYFYQEDRILVTDESGEIEKTYFLNDKGIIFKSTSRDNKESTYLYDNENQLIEMKSPGITNITWQDGNIIQVKEGNRQIYNYTYTDISSDKGIVISNAGVCLSIAYPVSAPDFPVKSRSNSDFGLDMDYFLYYTGYFGKYPKNLLASRTDKSGSDPYSSTTTYQFSYDFDELGNVATWNVMSDEDAFRVQLDWIPYSPQQ